MTEAYWYFYENYNPNFCPGKKIGGGMSMDDRFKNSRGCKRPISCDECRRLNIDKQTDIYRESKFTKFINQAIGIFYNYSFIWFLISLALFLFSFSQVFTIEESLNLSWLLLAVPSGIVTVHLFWFLFKVYRMG